MTTPNTEKNQQVLSGNHWFILGLVAAVASVVAVLLTEAVARAVWPEIVLFEPLNSYPRAVLFTVVPVAVATAVFRWISGRSARPERTFLIVAVVVLVVSFVPDYALPVANKTVLASTVAAFLHVVAGVVTVAVLLVGRRRLLGGA